MEFDKKTLAVLKAGARTKGLLKPEASTFMRTIHGLLFKTRNKVRYELPKASSIPRDFIRQEPWEIEYLFMLASRCRLGILEIGRFNGGTVLIFASSTKLTPIYSIDIAPQNDDRLRAIMEDIGAGENVTLITGDSQKTKYSEIGTVDLLFIDGDHSYEGCTNDLVNWWPSVAVGGHTVLHDSYFGNPVQDAAIDFIASHEVEVVLHPYNLHEHRRSTTGSLCHFIKRG